MEWTIKKLQAPSSKLQAEEIIKILLHNRGLKTKKEIDTFLNPLPPFNLTLKELGIAKRELAKAVKRIRKAIEDKEEMIVWGDYDADGVCGTAILWETIYALGGRVMPYIPDRVTEGYGLNKVAVKKLVTRNPQLTTLITVDHGITAHKKIDYAQKLGLDIIVTDHHQLGKTLPKAQAVVHSPKISGAAVAWVLARELAKQSEDISPNTSEVCERTPARWVFGNGNNLDLVSIGTIADLMPLIGPNRSFVKFGLKELNQTKRVGLLALLKEAGLRIGEIDPYQVGWMIAPRLNASGRLKDAMDSLRLLCTKDRQRAGDLALKLSKINKERQELLEKTFLQAEARVLKQELSLKNLLFLSDESYHEGIIGLVAGRLVQKFYRPAVVVSEGKTYSKASARSINGFDIIKAIRECEPDLVDCGGHPLAAGFTIETKKLKAVKKKILEIAKKALDKKSLTKSLKIDCEVRLADLNFELYQAISQLAPFGMGNPEPLFASRGLRVLNAKLVGKNQGHLKLLLDDPKTSKIERAGAEAELVSQLPFDGIGFGLGEIYHKLTKDRLIDIAYSLSLNEWNGKKRLELKIRDIKITQVSG